MTWILRLKIGKKGREFIKQKAKEQKKQLNIFIKEIILNYFREEKEKWKRKEEKKLDI